MNIRYMPENGIPIQPTLKPTGHRGDVFQPLVQGGNREERHSGVEPEIQQPHRSQKHGPKGMLWMVILQWKMIMFGIYNDDSKIL